MRPRPNPQARLRLFCLPYAGGGASMFRTWPGDLPADVEVCAVELPGRESRAQEPLFTRLPDLVGALAQRLLPYLDLPYALFGHSLGAFVSFELAQELRARHYLSPVCLFVSGQRAPHLPDPDPPISHLPDPEFIEEIRSRYDGLPQAVLRNPELMEFFLPILRADLAINETYAYQGASPLECPISAFGGLHDRNTTQEELAAWRDQTGSLFKLRLLPGDHFFIHSSRSPFLGAMFEDLRALGQGRHSRSAA